MTHELKTWTEYFTEIKSRNKTFELRKNDRDYKVGDILILQDFDNNSGQYSGTEIIAYVTYVLHGGAFGLDKGYCIMGLKIQ